MSVSIFNLKDRPSIKVQCNWDANIPEKSIEDTVSINFHKDDDLEEQTNPEDLKYILFIIIFVGNQRKYENFWLKIF